MLQSGNVRVPRTFSRRTFLAGGAAMLGHALGSRTGAAAQPDDRVQRLLEKYRVPGLCLSQIENGVPNPPVAYSLRSLTGPAPMKSDTVFEAASLSKPAFACAVMRLRDRGLLDLDAPLTKYLDEPFIPDEPRMEAITARLILSHQSGLPHGRAEGEPLKLQSDPGTHFQYSATGFDYLQRVAQKVSGQSFADLMQAEVLGPLGMADSSFEWRDSYAEVRTGAYDAQGKPGITFNEKYRTGSADWRAKVKELFPELNYPNAAAGLYTTAGDYARFLAAMLDPQRYPNWLAPDTVHEMLQPQISVNKGVAWGIGWGLMESGDGPVFWHWGNWSGLFQHVTAGIVNNKQGLTVLTNSGNGLKLCQELFPELLGLSLRPARAFLN